LLTPAFWTPLLAGLGARAHACPDHGADASIAAMADRALADAPDRFALVAHAMGGFVAFEIMRRAGARVSKLALLSTLAPNDTPAQTERREGYARLVAQGRFDQVVEERIPILLHPDRRSDADLVALVRRMADETGPERFLRQQRAIMTREDSRASLPSIAAPTLIVWGRQDGIATEAHQVEMRDAIPDARLEIVENCGHLLTLEQPAAVQRIILDWLD